MSFDHLLAVSCLAALWAVPTAEPQSAPAPLPTVLADVRLSDDPDAPRVAIVLDKGRITQVLGEGITLPPGHRVIEANGALALPAFVDACSHAGCEIPAANPDHDLPVSTEANVRIEMREANRKGLAPSFRTVEALELSEETLAGFREQGFAVLHTSPTGRLLGGTTTVTTTHSAALRDRVLVGDVFHSASFTARGSGYPGTLMGRIAHLRQFLFDAEWHEGRWVRYRAGQADARPPYDRDLESILPVLRGEYRLLCRADGLREIRRWLELARAWELKLVICGGREAWRVTAELLEAEVPVILDLEWGEEVVDPDATAEGVEDEAAETAEATEETVEPADWTYREPLVVQRERRHRWEEQRDCALRLHEAGVPFAFGSFDDAPEKLLEQARALVEAGLPEAAALAAMTTTAAELIGIDSHVGRLEVGLDADLALWSDSPYEKTAHLEWLIIDGAVHEYEHEDETGGVPAEGVDFTGRWVLTYQEREGTTSHLELDMTTEGVVKGTLSFDKAEGGGRSHSEVSGQVSGRTAKLEATVELGGLSTRIRMHATLEGEALSGDVTWKYSGGEETSAFTGEREPPESATDPDVDPDVDPDTAPDEGNGGDEQ